MARYMTVWQNRYLTCNAQSVAEMAAGLAEAAKLLQEMSDDGVQLECGVDDDYAFLVTEDATVAEKHGMEPEMEEDWQAECGEDEEESI